ADLDRYSADQVEGRRLAREQPGGPRPPLQLVVQPLPHVDRLQPPAVARGWGEDGRPLGPGPSADSLSAFGYNTDGGRDVPAPVLPNPEPYREGRRAWLSRPGWRW